MDKTSSDGDGEVRKALKPLKEDGVKIVPVAVGPDADRNQLKNITSTEEYLVDAKKSTTPEKLAEEIMEKVTSGRKDVGFSRPVACNLTYMPGFTRCPFSTTSSSPVAINADS